MFCVLELTAMKEEVACLHSEFIKNSLNPFYQPAYDLLLGFHEVIDTFWYICLCVYKHTHIHTHRYR